MAPVIRQTSSIDCGLAALAMLLRDKASITTSVTALDNLATVLIDPTTSRHRREGYSVSELQTLTAAFTHSLRARNLTLEEFYTRSFPLIAWIDSAQGGHFTLVEGATATSISLADPTRGRLSIAPDIWRELWLKETTGIVLELE
jgi:ABC-type bacteriocin/lantibiotic exporter with double-glycine peptidase domain